MAADPGGATETPRDGDEGVTAAATEQPSTRREARESAAVPSPKSGPRTLLGAIGTGLSVGLLALVALVALLAIVVPAAVGGRALTVLTSSMDPVYPAGTLVVVEPTPPAEIGIGDVLTYQLRSGEPVLVTHRVIAITNNPDGTRLFTTKGDANDVADADPVMEVQVVGTVMYAIPYLGWANTAVNGDARAWILPIIVGGLLVYAVWMVISHFRDKAKARRET